MDETKEWIERDFNEINYMPDITDVEKFAASLQCFPLACSLALQEAVNSIRTQQEQIRMFGGQDAIRFSFDDAFFTKHLNAAWNVTMDTIKQKGNDGKTAIRILEHMFSNNLNLIEPRNLHLLLKVDKLAVVRAILLLESYLVLSKVTNGPFEINRIGQRRL